MRICLSFLYPLNEAERKRLALDGSPPTILNEIPIALRGAAEFEAKRDRATDGVCAQLARRIESSAKDNPALIRDHAGYFAFDVTVYSNLSTSGAPLGARPLLYLSSIRLSLADVDLASSSASSRATRRPARLPSKRLGEQCLSR